MPATISSRAVSEPTPLNGGGGNDTFRIADDSGLMKTITDFNAATDQIELATDASGRFLALGIERPAGQRPLHS